MATKTYELPKTKDPFRRWLEAMPAKQELAPADTTDCFLCRFMIDRCGLQTDPFFTLTHYNVGPYDDEMRRASRELPEWARAFTENAYGMRTVLDEGASSFGPMYERTITVAKARKALAQVE